MTDAGAVALPALRVAASGGAGIAAERDIAVEAPVAFEYNGIGYAVMMATPTDLEDFATGFTLSERLAADSRDILSITISAHGDGWLVRVQLRDTLAAPLLARARQRISDSGCGLCGIETLEQVLRPLPVLTARPQANAAAIFAARAALSGLQTLNDATGAVHAAAFCDSSGRIDKLREDVGRHNALDKLIGALARAGRMPAGSFVLVTSRCSYELVEKAVLSGCPLLVTLSAATSIAVTRARQAGLTLVCLARADSLLVLHDPHGIFV